MYTFSRHYRGMNIPLQCQCGKLQGMALDISAEKNHRTICYCDDCQCFAYFLGHAKDILDANGGTDITPIAPAQIKITQGSEHLKCMRLSEKGMYRWYTGCCKTPIANTMSNYKFPYAGTIHSIMNHKATGKTREEALGPIFSRLQGKFGISPLPPGTSEKASFKFILSVIQFLVPALLFKKYKPSPFFTDDGIARVEPYVLSLQERSTLRAYCGPSPSAFQK